MQAGSLGSGDISFPIEPIIMGPPNLKIHVKRKYKIDKDLTASSDTITRLIGFEGASLTSDNFVAIYTDWLDHDGRPMPESLKGAGYTGRIATIASDQALSSVNQFSIDPGQKLQVLQLPTALTDSTHFYLHVSGEPKSGNPIFAGSTDSQRLKTADFSTSGQNPGILAKRPDNYVPFLSPVYDEANTELQTQAYRLLKKDDPDTYNEAPEPLYKWVYRPEMQFTSYDLTISEINKTRDTNENGITDPGETINILNDETPLITSDSVIDLLYDLSTTDLDALDYFNAGETKELVFVIGEQEVIATIGADQTINFGDLSSLDLLSPDDFLTIRLYANNDMGNVLWQYAFINVALAADFNRDGVIEFSPYLYEKEAEKDKRTDLNTNEKPYVFWVNDDDDDPDSEVSGNDINEWNTFFSIYKPDHSNDSIDGSRDLIDFFPVAINLTFPEGEDTNTGSSPDRVGAPYLVAFSG